MSVLLDLPVISVTGSPRKMGLSQGEAYREQLQAFVDLRLRSCRVYLFENGGNQDPQVIAEVGAKCLEMLEGWDPEGYAEHCGVAEGAGLDPVDLYAAANLSDIRDVILYKFSEDFVWPPPDPDAEGCSALIVPPTLTADGKLLAGQTWDLNPADLDFIIAVNRMPAEGPETWGVSCMGCPPNMGINEHGVAVGCTNIKTVDPQVGVGYLSLVGRALRSRTYQEAGGTIAGAPRAAAHAYWVVGPDGGVMFECSGRMTARRDLVGGEPICQTNHCVDEMFDQIQADDPSISSICRYDRMLEKLEPGGQNLDSLRAIMADRSAGFESINRYPEDDLGTATNACFVAIPGELEAWACRGSADRGKWIRLDF